MKAKIFSIIGGTFVFSLLLFIVSCKKESLVPTIPQDLVTKVEVGKDGIAKLYTKDGIAYSQNVLKLTKAAPDGSITKAVIYSFGARRAK